MFARRLACAVGEPLPWQGQGAARGAQPLCKDLADVETKLVGELPRGGMRPERMLCLVYSAPRLMRWVHRPPRAVDGATNRVAHTSDRLAARKLRPTLTCTPLPFERKNQQPRPPPSDHESPKAFDMDLNRTTSAHSLSRAKTASGQSGRGPHE